jgi:hypothetical protein
VVTEGDFLRRIETLGSCSVHILRHDSTQKSSQKIGTGYDALLLPPDQDQIVVDDIIFGMFRLHLHATDHAAQRKAPLSLPPLASPG